jgi:hypothetical protein
VGKAALTGAPVTLATGLSAGEGVNAASVSATGLVAYRVGGASETQLTWFDRSGAARGNVEQPDGALFDPRVAPDGRRMVVARVTAQGTNLWLLDGERMSRLTFGASIDYSPVWSPDGTRIMFATNRSGGLDLYQIYGLPLRCKRVFAFGSGSDCGRYIRPLVASVEAGPDDDSLAGASRSSRCLSHRSGYQAYPASV